MNILQVSYGLFNGGVSNHILTLTKNFISNNNKVVILSFEIPDRSNDIKIQKLGAKIYYLPFSKVKKNPLLSLYIIKEIVKIIKTEEIDIIHSHYRKLNIYLEIVSRLINIPYIWTYHCAGVPNEGLVKLLSFYGDKSIAISNETKDDLIKRIKINDNKVELVHNGIDTEDYKNYCEDKNKLRKKYNIDESKWVISVLARIAEVKGQKEAILALERMSNNKDVLLLLTGAPNDSNYNTEYYESVKNIIREKELDNKVKIMGFEDAKEILHLSDICLLPSYKEGFPLVCLESMAMGVPLVRTKTSGWEELKDYCEVVEIGDVKGISSKIELLKNNKSRYLELSHKGVKFVSENFDHNIMCNKIMNIYQNAIDERLK